MPTIEITEDNCRKFPIGTQCEFFWGCPVDTGGGDWEGEQSTEALVCGWGYEPAGKWNNAYCYLDVETKDGKTHQVRKFVTSGVGCYLTQNVEGI